MRAIIFLILIAFIFTAPVVLKAQKTTDQVYVDRYGVMRWTKDHSELHGFGVNYTLPFAHEYRMALRSATSPEEAIRQDIYHMARLDLDFYRVHVFDTEISDSLGNLINNEHLRLFDYMINEMERRGMHFIITPIAWWGNGWPENDEKTQGFSAKYGKNACLTNPDAIRAQANYLNQFISHVNRYTGKNYKDDPSVIGFEVCNEPHHNGLSQNVTGFINTMVSAIRNSGCSKPVFYNMSHSVHLADAYLNADIQGGTFQWYPTNLVANHQIDGNFLPNVASYPIPFAGDPKFRKMAKIVYEFDAADAAGNYMYPAMASTFRKTGMQLAAQFAYDAMCWAPWNTNYGTHFMNLAYTPQKAISLKIASAVFHSQALYQEASASLKVSYTDDLALWISNEKFFYSNNTTLAPPEPKELKEIAGWGSSPLVRYTGTGAYFLDKLDEGVWRLEIMPDAFWINDPYSPVSPKIQKAAVIHSRQTMVIDLPDLGSEFKMEPLNQGNTFTSPVSKGKFDAVPGVYILKSGNSNAITPNTKYKNIDISEYIAPATNLDRKVIWNHAPAEASAGKPFVLEFNAVSTSNIEKAEVLITGNRHWKTLTAACEGNGRFRVELPAEFTDQGFLDYRIVIYDEKDTTVFPGPVKGSPYNWENRNSGTWRIGFIPAGSPLMLWNADRDWDYSWKIWDNNVNLVPDGSGTVLKVNFAAFPHQNPLDSTEQSWSFKYYFGDKIKGRMLELLNIKSLALKVTNHLNTKQPVELGLIDKNGSVVTAALTIEPGDTVCRLPIESLTEGSCLILPRPYPDFLPLRIKYSDSPFDRRMVEMLQITLRQGQQNRADLLIEKIWLE